jgi:leader peptidase (prepilin peptidase)/N-methyltransferase
MGETTIRIALAAGLGVALLGARDAGPAAVGALYVATVTTALVQYDLRERRLPDALVLPGLAFVAVGVVWSALGGGRGLEVPVAAVVCALGVLVAFLVLASGGGLGMGDVKLAMLLGAALAAVVAERAPPGGGPGMPGAGAAVAAAGGAVVAWVVASLVLGGLAAGVMLASGARRPVAAPTELPFGPVLLATFWTVALSW